MVTGLGVLVLAAKALVGLTVGVGFGHPEHGPVALTCVVVGLASILAGTRLPDGQDGATKGRAPR